MAAEYLLISIIIPAYNSAQFLAETLESALAQTWPNAEIIVVNDGSTDPTAEVLSAYQGRIRSIDQENQGLSGARNSGMRMAQGELFAFLDADDLIRPQFLENMARTFLADPDLDVAYCGWGYIDEAGKKLPEAGKFQFSGPVINQMVLANRFPVMATMIRKTSATQTGFFDPSLRSTEDWDFWLRAALCGAKFQCVPQELVQYRIHDSNMSANITRMHDSQLQVLDKFYANQGLPESVTQLKGRAYGRVYLTTAQAYLRAGQDEAARQAFIQSVRQWPEMLCQEETYYTIICALQPPGYRDTQQYKDLEWATQILGQLLEAVFQEPALKAQVAGKQARAEATKALALAHHYSLAGQDGQARHWVAQAIKAQPTLAVDRQTIRLGGRALLGRKRSQQIKQMIRRSGK